MNPRLKHTEEVMGGMRTDARRYLLWMVAFAFFAGLSFSHPLFCGIMAFITAWNFAEAATRLHAANALAGLVEIERRVEADMLIEEHDTRLERELAQILESRDEHILDFEPLPQPEQRARRKRKRTPSSLSISVSGSSTSVQVSGRHGNININTK